MRLDRRKFMPEKTAFAKNIAIKTSVQKLSLVTDLIRGLTVSDALYQLQFCKKKVAKDVRLVLSSAIANAENNNRLDIDKLYVSKILVGKAFALKRFNVRARGRMAKIIKPFSRVAIFVSEKRG